MQHFCGNPRFSRSYVSCQFRWEKLEPTQPRARHFLEGRDLNCNWSPQWRFWDFQFGGSGVAWFWVKAALHWNNYGPHIITVLSLCTWNKTQNMNTAQTVIILKSQNMNENISQTGALALSCSNMAASWTSLGDVGSQKGRFLTWATLLPPRTAPGSPRYKRSITETQYHRRDATRHDATSLPVWQTSHCLSHNSDISCPTATRRRKISTAARPKHGSRRIIHCITYSSHASRQKLTSATVTIATSVSIQGL